MNDYHYLFPKFNSKFAKKKKIKKKLNTSRKSNLSRAKNKNSTIMFR